MLQRVEVVKTKQFNPNRPKIAARRFPHPTMVMALNSYDMNRGTEAGPKCLEHVMACWESLYAGQPVEVK
jgi:hypothetical protein